MRILWLIFSAWAMEISVYYAEIKAFIFRMGKKTLYSWSANKNHLYVTKNQ